MDYASFYSNNARLMIPSPIRKMAYLVERPGIISLAGGMPSAETFPMGLIGTLLDEVYSRRGAPAFQYQVTRGNRKLIEWLAAFMRTRGVTTRPENVILTSGSQQGLRLLSDILLSPGDVALVELPSYIGGTSAMRNAGARLVGVPQVGDGIVTEDLDAIAGRLKAEGQRVKLFYTIPNFQNPSGVTKSFEKRKEVLRIARKHDFLIIEDDPYYELYFGAAAEHPTMMSMDDDGRVIYMSSFSKVLTPGLRTAWICGPEEIIRTIELAKEAADLCSSTLDQEIVLAYCDGGHLEAHVPHIRKFYYDRRNVILDALRAHMPEGVKWTEPAGGFFTWLRLPPELDSEEMLHESVERGVAYVIGGPFHVDGSGRNTLRLAFSKEPPQNLQRGVQILGGLVSERLQAGALKAVVS